MTTASVDQGAQAPYPTAADIEKLTRVYWQHKQQGGRYRVEAVAKGAGTLHGQPVVFYSELPVPTMIYALPLSQWHDAMETIDA